MCDLTLDMVARAPPRKLLQGAVFHPVSFHVVDGRILDVNKKGPPPQKADAQMMSTKALVPSLEFTPIAFHRRNPGQALGSGARTAFFVVRFCFFSERAQARLQEVT